MSDIFSQLISTAEAERHLDAPDVRFVDASWHMPDTGRDARAEFEAAHIPGAVFFDIDEIADTDSDLPHMLPSLEKFSSRMRRLGLGDGHRIVVYDNSDIRSAARAWWMLRIFGHQDTAILNGGLQKWVEEGRPTTSAPRIERPQHFTAKFDNTRLRSFAQVRENVNGGREQLLDARSFGRFTGEEAEPRAEVASGHIPGAANLHYAHLFNDDGTYKSPDELKLLFQSSNIDLGRPVVTSCGSGITACALAFALDLLGHRQVAVYDGSWSEWGTRADAPVETGEPR